MVESAARSYLPFDGRTSRHIDAHANGFAPPVELVNRRDGAEKRGLLLSLRHAIFEVEKVAQLLTLAPRLDTLLVPEVEGTTDVDGVVGLINLHGQRRKTPIGLEVMIETALGLVNCEQIAGRSELIESLHFGVGDFSASIGQRGWI
ncbi:aldolase/citrate lyase family protein [Paraburkholderia sp. UYCP14C]|uniref:aldolase/citrate lyase family protein n=1 Tax=Paraburkholderia sp. UYCP14C TaxID=2511130 RepID=UPI0020070C0B|nr:aldolase/citrate lyase family protein [Paraburkholderia sp. UYCP14C]